MEYLEITDIRTDPRRGMGGIGHLKIVPHEQEICLKWHDDWDTSAYSDTIRINLLTGNIAYTYYVESNYNFRTEEIHNRDITIQALQHIKGRLIGDSPEYQKARQTIDELVKRIKI